MWQDVTFETAGAKFVFIMLTALLGILMTIAICVYISI